MSGIFPALLHERTDALGLVPGARGPFSAPYFGLLIIEHQPMKTQCTTRLLRLGCGARNFPVTAWPQLVETWLGSLNADRQSPAKSRPSDFAVPISS
jgi:hypothetical protein